MRDHDNGADQARTWSPMGTSPVRRGSYVLKDQRIRVIGLEQDAVARDTVGLGHWPCYCSGLSYETSPELATQLPQAPCYMESLKPSSSWSQGAFLLPDAWWQSDQVVVFYLCSLLIWTIKLYPTELLSESSNAALVKALLGLQNEEQAQKQH